MCPTTPQPGIFDLTAPHTPLLVWSCWLVFLLLALLAVGCYRWLFQCLPSGHARRIIARLYSVQFGFVFGGLVLESLTSLWSDALLRWSISQAGICVSLDQTLENFDKTPPLQETLGSIGMALLLAGLALTYVANLRFRRERAALLRRRVAPQR